METYCGATQGSPRRFQIEKGAIRFLCSLILRDLNRRTDKQSTMIKLSRTVAYAIQATLQLAKADSDTPVPCSRLAADGEMPERFLLQILRNLVTHGILKSTRGVEGGYTLVRSPEQISILEVIEAIDGPLSSESAVASGLDETAQQNLRTTLESVAATARKQLESVSLSQIIGATNGHGTAEARIES